MYFHIGRENEMRVCKMCTLTTLWGTIYWSNSNIRLDKSNIRQVSPGFEIPDANHSNTADSSLRNKWLPTCEVFQKGVTVGVTIWCIKKCLRIDLKLVWPFSKSCYSNLMPICCTEVFIQHFCQKTKLVFGLSFKEFSRIKKMMQYIINRGLNKYVDDQGSKRKNK